jgi:hypothetical protein
MEERIRNEVYGAVDILLHAEEQLERSARLVACWERYVLKLATLVHYVFACLTVMSPLVP